MIIEPYTYVRIVTFGLGAVWTIRGVIRLRRFVLLWRARLEDVGMSRQWLHRQVMIFALRTTILDPINLALLLILFGSWSIRGLVT